MNLNFCRGRAWIVIITGVILYGSLACTEQDKTKTGLFQTIFLEEKGLFRGINLGMGLTEVRAQEEQAPRHDDLLGLTYYYPLADSQQLFLEYYTGLSESGLRGDSLKAILANVFLRDEMIAAELYREIQAHFRSQLGISLGDYGNDIWEGETSNGRMEVLLRFNEGGKGLSINFVEIEN